MENQPSGWLSALSALCANFEFFQVGKLEGHERACRRSISNQIGTSRIPVKKSIVLNGQSDVLSYPGVGLRAKYWIFFLIFFSFVFLFYCFSIFYLFVLQDRLKPGFDL